MKKLAILVTAVLVAALLSLAGAALAASNAAPHATGSIEYYQSGYFFDFNAHEEYDRRPAKGEAYNQTPYGGWYRAVVRCVNIDTDTALFAAELVETNMSSWGPWVLVKVLDGGTPGTVGDLIWGQFLSEQDAMNNCLNGVDPTGGPWPVLDGNLVVHTY